MSDTAIVREQGRPSGHGDHPLRSSGLHGDVEIRRELLARMEQQSSTDFGSRKDIVSDGVVHLWGLVSSEAEHKALLALAEDVPGVSRVSDEMFPAY
jgi:osmotically-inducible protein OsmY